MKGNCGWRDTTPVNCPSLAILSLDDMGRIKQPCCIESADNNGLKPICEQWRPECYSILYSLHKESKAYKNISTCGLYE